MNVRFAALVASLVVFSAYTAVVVVQHGYTGFLPLAWSEAWAGQMLVDLAIALVLFAGWLVNDARQRGIAAWPYLLLIATTGSIGALAYLTHRTLRDVRRERYSSLGGFFPGVTDQEGGDADAPILRTILIGPDAAAVGKTLGSLNLAAMEVQVTAVRRKGAREINPSPETRLAAGDVLVLLGTQGRLARAEIRILQG